MGFMIFFHELGHFATAKWAGVKVNEFSIGMGPKLVSKTVGETTYALRLFPIGGFVAMEGEDEESSDERSLLACPVWKRIIITAAGAFMNLLLGFIVIVFLTSGQELIGTTTIAQFYENSATEKYLEINDTIVGINGEKISCDQDIVYALVRDRDGIVSMDVMRENEILHFDEVVFDTETLEDGSSMVVLDFSIYGTEKTLKEVVSYSFKWIFSLVKLVWNSLFDLIKGNFSLNQISGPVGLTQTMSEVASSTDITGILRLLALVTVNLGVFNLIPLPALDGGRIFFMFIELIFGKPVNRKVEATIHGVGMMLLMLFSVIIAFNDIFKIVTGG